MLKAAVAADQSPCSGCLVEVFLVLDRTLIKLFIVGFRLSRATGNLCGNKWNCCGVLIQFFESIYESTAWKTYGVVRKC